MTCKCVNELGDKALRCSGLCVERAMLNPEAQINFREDTDVRIDKLEYRMNSFIDSLRVQIDQMKEINLSSWKEGFMEGINAAIVQWDVD